MWEHSVRMPARWLTHEEALKFLGTSEEKFKRLVGAGLLATDGNRSGRRYDAEDVYAVGVLLSRLTPLLGTEPAPEPE